MGAKQSIKVNDLNENKTSNILQDIQKELSSYFIIDIINIIIEYVNGDAINNYLWYSKEEYKRSYDKKLYKHVILDGDVIYYLYNIQNIKLYIYNLFTEDEQCYDITKQYYNILKFLKDGNNLYIIRQNCICVCNIVTKTINNFTIKDLRPKDILDIKNNIIFHTSDILPIINNEPTKLKLYNVKYYHNMITKRMSKKFHLPASMYGIVKPSRIFVNNDEVLHFEFKENEVKIYIFNLDCERTSETIHIGFDTLKTISKINILNFNCYEVMFEIDFVHVHKKVPRILSRNIYVYSRINNKIHRSTSVNTIYDCKVSNDNVIYFSDNKIFLYKRIL